MKVHIVGGAGGDMPKVDIAPDVELWGLNAIYPKKLAGVAWDRRFNIHRLAHLERDWSDGLAAEHAWAWHYFREGDKSKFYVTDDWPTGRLPNQEVFPADEINKYTESIGARWWYHASSFDWLVAYAMTLHAAEIHIYGLKETLNFEEPISARACLEYWIGFAEGRGVIVTQSKQCDLFKQFHLVASDSVYGYDDVHLIEDRTKDRP